MPIRAVAFDIDGTLYPEWGFFLRQFPLCLRSPLLCFAYWKVRKDLRVHDLYDPPLQREQARRVLRLLGRSSGEAAAERMERLLHERLYRHWDRLFLGMKPFAGVREALEQLRAQGYALAALSDFPVGNKLQVLGLEDLFTLFFSAEEIGYLKPSRMPFCALAEELGYAVEEILYVGNSVSKDILGARNAGMPAALFQASARLREPVVLADPGDDCTQPHIRFSSYQQLPEAAARLRQLTEQGGAD